MATPVETPALSPRGQSSKAGNEAGSQSGCCSTTPDHASDDEDLRVLEDQDPLAAVPPSVDVASPTSTRQQDARTDPGPTAATSPGAGADQLPSLCATDVAVHASDAEASAVLHPHQPRDAEQEAGGGQPASDDASDEGVARLTEEIAAKTITDPTAATQSAREESSAAQTSVTVPTSASLSTVAHSCPSGGHSSTGVPVPAQPADFTTASFAAPATEKRDSWEVHESSDSERPRPMSFRTKTLPSMGSEPRSPGRARRRRNTEPPPPQQSRGLVGNAVAAGLAALVALHSAAGAPEGSDSESEVEVPTYARHHPSLRPAHLQQDEETEAEQSTAEASTAQIADPTSFPGPGESFSATVHIAAAYAWQESMCCTFFARNK
mmetsp:Transcript_2323/g.5557  ORF Transcript_2323/g.5557 Transcript_2323/m.5557 type:complete len:380 (-) Transcript_2323:43-1182(-)